MAQVIHHTALVGEPLRHLQGCVQSSNASFAQVTLPETCYIGPYCIIGCGAKIGERTVLDSHVSIEPNAVLEEDCLIMYRSTVGGSAKIGPRSQIGGFIPENTIIGRDCRVLGTLTHMHNDPSIDWDHHEEPEPAAVLEHRVFVGLGALIVGHVHLGHHVYVCAGAIVKTDVPPYHIVNRSGELISRNEWRGKLAESSFWETR